MKRSLLFGAVLITLFFTQCKKDTAKTDATTEQTALSAGYTITAQNMLNVESVKALPNQNEKKIAYGLLQPIEKYLAWIENVKIVSTNFTPQQKALTLELINFLSPALFDTKDLGKTASFRDQWLEKAQKFFTYNQIRSIAYQLFVNTDSKSPLSVNVVNDGGEVDPDTGMKSCNCYSGSVHDCNTIDGMSFCPSDYYHGDCKNKTTWQCGFLWWSPCDNVCYTLKN